MSARTMNVRIALLLSIALPGACTPAATPPAERPLAGARIGGAFALTDQDARRFTDRDLTGRYRIMYFGYTFCPDVCPVDVQKIGAGLKLFEARDAAHAAKVVPVFVSVDPQRDTPAVLKQFVSAFHPRMIGLTGTPAQIAEVAKAYGVFFQAKPTQPGGGYMVDHSRQAYLMAPDGAPIALLPQDGTPAEVADELAKWVR